MTPTFYGTTTLVSMVIVSSFAIACLLEYRVIKEREWVSTISDVVDVIGITDICCIGVVTAILSGAILMSMYAVFGV